MRQSALLPLLPTWATAQPWPEGATMASRESRMRWVQSLALNNIKHRSGGPFAAAVFERDNERIVSIGLNIVVSTNCSLWHAETVAIAYAQAELGTYNLAATILPPLELVISAQPCVQCFGAIWWSGLRSVVFGARGEDIEELTGFREGPLPKDWKLRLQQRSSVGLPPVEVVGDVLRDEARSILSRYTEDGLPIYNPVSGKESP